MKHVPEHILPSLLIVRALAAVDAVLVPSVLLYWATTWPKADGMFTALFCTAMVLWALKRVSRAVFDFDRYRWTVRYVAWAMMLTSMFQAVRWILSL